MFLSAMNTAAGQSITEIIYYHKSSADQILQPARQRDAFTLLIKQRKLQRRGEQVGASPRTNSLLAASTTRRSPGGQPRSRGQQGDAAALCKRDDTLPAAGSTASAGRSALHATG